MLFIERITRYFLAHVVAALAAATALFFDLRLGMPVEGRFYGIEIVTYLPVNLAATTVGAWLTMYFAQRAITSVDGESRRDERAITKTILLWGGTGVALLAVVGTLFFGVLIGLIAGLIGGAAMTLAGVVWHLVSR